MRLPQYELLWTRREPGRKTKKLQPVVSGEPGLTKRCDHEKNISFRIPALSVYGSRGIAGL